MKLNEASRDIVATILNKMIEYGLPTIYYVRLHRTETGVNLYDGSTTSDAMNKAVINSPAIVREKPAELVSLRNSCVIKIGVECDGCTG